MRIQGIEFDGFVLSVAAKLAHLPDDAQAKFFDVFAEELEKCCDTVHGAGMQALYIRDKVKSETRELFAYLGDSEKA